MVGCAVDERIVPIAAVMAVAILSVVSLASADSIPVYDYVLINTFPHDVNAFTQGLVYHNGFLYEGTGLFSGSSLRKVVLETGEVLFRYNLVSVYFGEGVTIYDDLIYQLTWLNNVGFVYVETDSFELIDTFSYPTQGWGLTHDDTSLIMSDGTDKLYFLDPVTFEEINRVHVTADGSPIDQINELEYIHGHIYANILNSDFIAIIKPETGVVVAWLDLTGILSAEHPAAPPGPLNGIAFDPDSVRLFVTGKRWPSLFEIYVDPLNCGVDGPCDGEDDRPEAATLSQSRPNPFTLASSFTYTISSDATSPVHVTVHDATGRLVRTLVNQVQGPGSYNATWDGTDREGNPVASGVYFYHLKWNGQSVTRRTVLLR
jgi:glutamine cyclotransferase